MMPLRAVTFDFHNTLAECDDWFQIEIRALVSRFLDWHADHGGREVTDEDRATAESHYRGLRREIIHHGRERDAYECVSFVLQKMGRSVDPCVTRVGIDEIMMTALPGSTPVDGVIDAVRDLRGHGLKLGVVSSAAHHGFLEWSLTKFGILNEFDVVISSAGCGHYKSRRDIYDHALDQLGVVAEEAVHVGDSYRFDVEMAGQAGMRTVWFARADIDEDENGSDLTVSRLTGLSRLILDRFGAT
jgi:FMN phosphatase YigB (HAD superfamily)